MRNIRKHALILTVSGLALASLPGAVWAQDKPADEDNGGLAEIVVTAQRSSQKLLDVPLSISATSGEQLSSSGIRAMNELQLTTPGFVPSNSSGYNQMFIRGIGNAIFVGADPSVATFIDDVPRVFGTLVNNFVDVERVEIIKGAPGALYGRNATGGAVNIITRQPSTEEFSGAARISAGTKESFQGSVFVNVPLGDKVAMTLAGERRKHGDFIRNITPDANAYTAAMFPVNNVAGPGTASILGTPAQTAAFFNSGLVAKKGHVSEDFWAVSGKILFKPSDTFKLTIAGDYSKKDDDTGNSGYNTTPGYVVGALSGFLNTPFAFFFPEAATTTTTLASLNVPVTEKFTTAQRGAGFARLKDWGVSATAVLELGGVDVTSITSYRKNQSEFLTELGSNPFAMLEAHVPLEKKTFYQELRAVSTGEGPLHWIAGASYLRAQFDGGLFTTILRPYILETPSGSGGYVVKNWSAYAQFTYDLTEQMSLMASGRYIHETNDARSLNGALLETVKLTEKKFLPAATLSYKLAGGGNVYARWARGFKAGGIVPVVPISAFDSPTTPTVKETDGAIFKGEEVDTFELGFKAPLANNKVQVTGAVFYNAYRNVQVAAHARPAFPTITIAVVNAGSARTYGAEATVTARVADPLTIGVSAGYLNARYNQLVIPATNPVLSPLNLSNTRMINSPEWQFSVNADLDQPISDNLRLVGNIAAGYTDEVLWQASANPANGLPDAIGKSYWLANARLGVKSADSNWELAVYAKNLFNAGYSTFGNSSESYGNILLWGDPRIIGIEANVKF